MSSLDLLTRLRLRKYHVSRVFKALNSPLNLAVIEMPALNRLLPLVMLTWLVGYSILLAQDRAVVERGKAASVLVDNQVAKGIGTGFCIHPSGLFVTNNHVVDQRTASAECQARASCPVRAHVPSTLLYFYSLRTRRAS